MALLQVGHHGQAWDMEMVLIGSEVFSQDQFTQVLLQGETTTAIAQRAPSSPNQEPVLVLILALVLVLVTTSLALVSLVTSTGNS